MTPKVMGRSIRFSPDAPGTDELGLEIGQFVTHVEVYGDDDGPVSVYLVGVSNMSVSRKAYQVGDGPSCLDVYVDLYRQLTQ